MEIQNLGSRKKRYVDLATRMAQQSTYGSIKHGAVLIKGGSVLNAAYNKDNYCGFGDRFRERDSGYATLHAELGCVLNLDRSVTHGAEVYVVRVNSFGEYRMSRPCPMCRAALEHVGISRVHFTTDENTLETLKL
jgi:tRNA(Arg) A34 adenosine deaminase TadA